jgi:hypothetical protein
MPELGKKFECAECGAKFYDLGKAEPACPRCGTSARETSEKRPAPEPRARYVAPPPPVADVEEDLAPDDIVEDDEEILVVGGAEVEEEEDDDDDEV